MNCHKLSLLINRMPKLYRYNDPNKNDLTQNSNVCTVVKEIITGSSHHNAFPINKF